MIVLKPANPVWERKEFASVIVLTGFAACNTNWCNLLISAMNSTMNLKFLFLANNETGTPEKPIS